MKARVSSSVRFLGRNCSSGGGDVVAEEEVGEIAELAQGFDAGLDERCDGAEVVVGKEDGAELVEELFARELAQVLAVEPLELDEIEDGAAERDALEDEVLNHLLEAEDFNFGVLLFVDLAARGHAAAHEAEEVEHGAGQEAGLAIVDERDGIFALGDLALVDIAQERHVPEAREIPAEGLVEQHVLGGGGDPLFGADDVGDAHEVVIDDVGEVVGGEAVGLEQDLVVDVVV